MNGKSVAPDGIKMAAGATETGRIRKNVAPDGIKMAAEATETKTKRVQLVFQPTLYKMAKAEAKRRGTSLNDLVHIALRAYFEMEERK